MIAWVLALVAGQSSPSLLARVFPHPTGQNGYEDYLRAADLVNDDLAVVFVSGKPSVSYDRSVPESSLPGYQVQSDLVEQLGRLDYLTNRRRMVERYGAAVDLIEKGNSKPIQDPRDAISIQKFPEAVPFSNICAVAAAKSYVLGADGEGDGSLRALTAALLFSSRTEGKNYLTYMLGELGTQPVYERIHDYLPTASLSQCSTLEAFAESELQKPPKLSDLIQGEEASRAVQMNQWSKDPETMRAVLAQFGPFQFWAQGANSDQLTAVGNSLPDALKSSTGRFLSDLQAPEEEWYDRSKAWPRSLSISPTSLTAPRDVAASAELLIAKPPYRLVYFELVRRTRLRLVALNAKILAFRWRNHRLPRTLNEIGSKAEIFDPLANTPFLYGVLGKDQYRIFSGGRPETGPIELGVSSTGEPLNPGVP